MIPAHRWTETSGATLLPTYDPQKRSEFAWPDGTVRVVIDNPANVFYIEASAQAMPSTLKAVRLHLERIGLSPEPSEECEPEMQDDGYIRIYYAPIESYSDDEALYAMPSLAETGFGPFSMEIPAISQALIEEDVRRCERMVVTEDDVSTDIRPALPPLPYAPPTSRRYEQATTGPKPRGRHRSNTKRSFF